jgi:hypothetical protein
MKAPVALLAFALLSVGGVACGGANGVSAGGASSAHIRTVRRGLGPHGHEDADGDYDLDPLGGDYGRVAEAQDRRAVMAVATSAAGAREVEAHVSEKTDRDHDTDDHQAILAFGGTADAADQRAVTIAVKRYYAAAAAGDGARGCSLLVSSLAATVASDYGHTRYLRGGSCAAVLSKLFRRRHAELVADRDTLEVLPARVRGDLIVALLSWTQSSREGQIVLRRERGAWKLAGLLDGPRPLDGEAR